MWKVIASLYNFCMIWKERNRITFKNGDLLIQRLKNSFVRRLWSWTKVFMDRPLTLIIFFFFGLGRF